MTSAVSSTTTKTLLVGLSGPSSSGKTTLARFLRSIFNLPASSSTSNRSITLFILHEDDFYKTDKDIPVKKIAQSHRTGLPEREVQDWDCVESLDLPLLESTLQYIKSHGRLPPDTLSKEDQNEVGPSTVPQSLIDARHQKIQTWLEHLSTDDLPDDGEIRICLLDGFLLYPDKSSGNAGMQKLYSLSGLMDLKLWVSCSREQMIERRTRRKGYVTLEGFWEDPPGYVEDLVWPNFTRDHAWLCGEEGDQGTLLVNEDEASQQGIVVAPGKGDASMEELVEWAAGVVASQLR